MSLAQFDFDDNVAHHLVRSSCMQINRRGLKACMDEDGCICRIYCLYSIQLSLHCRTIFSGRIYSCVLSMVDCVRGRMYGRKPTHDIYLQIAPAIHDWRQSTRRITIREKPPITSRNAKILSTHRSPSIIPSIISSLDGRMSDAAGAENVGFG